MPRELPPPTCRGCPAPRAPVISTADPCWCTGAGLGVMRHGLYRHRATVRGLRSTISPRASIWHRPPGCPLRGCHRVAHGAHVRTGDPQRARAGAQRQRRRRVGRRCAGRCRRRHGVGSDEQRRQRGGDRRGRRGRGAGDESTAGLADAASAYTPTHAVLDPLGGDFPDQVPRSRRWPIGAASSCMARRPTPTVTLNWRQMYRKAINIFGYSGLIGTPEGEAHVL